MGEDKIMNMYKYPPCPTCGLNSMIMVEKCVGGAEIVSCMYCDLPQEPVYENVCWACGKDIDSRTSVQSATPGMGYHCEDPACGKDLTEWKGMKPIV